MTRINVRFLKPVRFSLNILANGSPRLPAIPASGAADTAVRGDRMVSGGLTADWPLRSGSWEKATTMRRNGPLSAPPAASHENGGGRLGPFGLDATRLEGRARNGTGLSNHARSGSSKDGSRIRDSGPGAEYSGYTLYLREIGQVPRLTSEEEVELAQRVRRGDEEARDLLIKANLRLVVKIAREYEGMGVPLLDLVNEGNIGLMKAAERFDPGKGAKFSTYGSLWIKQAIKRALSNQKRDVRLPVHVQEKVQQIEVCILKLTDRYGRAPSSEEVSRATGLPAHKIRRMIDASQAATSLNLRVNGGEDGAELGEAILDERAVDPSEQLEGRDLMEWMGQFIRSLKPREWDILRRRFGLDGGPSETLDEIGQSMSLTREAVRQIQNRALERLRKCFSRVMRGPELALS